MSSVTVQTLKDNLVEGTELMEFVLFTGGSNWDPGSPSTATTRVADDPAGVSISRAATGADGAETPDNTAPMNYTVTPAGGNLNEALVVYVARSGGTATAGADYVPPTDPITIGANESTKTFSVGVVDDDRYEPQEIAQPHRRRQRQQLQHRGRAGDGVHHQ